MSRLSLFIAAGGTGGHLFPAEALAAELAKQGYDLHLITDARGKRVAGSDKPWRYHAIQSGGIAGKNIWQLLVNITRLGSGFLQSLCLALRYRPHLAVGFGGYVSLPPLLAAKMFGAKIIIHEQNAQAGRANRFLKPFATKIATGFPQARGLGEDIIVTGNPARPAILALYQQAYLPPQEKIHLLITGGSQGARSFSSLIPEALVLLSDQLKTRLEIVQQVRAEDLKKVQGFYEKQGNLKTELKPFFDDMEKRLAWAHLVIARAGASTLTELALSGKPAILIPLPNSIDHHQDRNAEIFAQKGAVIMLAERKISPRDLAETIERLLSNSGNLSKMSLAMEEFSRPDAAKELARLALDLIQETPKEKNHARFAS